MTGIVEEISLIFLEEVRVRGEVLNIRLGMNLNEIYTPPHAHKLRIGFRDEPINGNNESPTEILRT